MVESLLDQVPGLGEVRRKALIKYFGSLKKLRAASVEEIAAVPGFGTKTAMAIKRHCSRRRCRRQSTWRPARCSTVLIASLASSLGCGSRLGARLLRRRSQTIRRVCSLLLSTAGPRSEGTGIIDLVTSERTEGQLEADGQTKPLRLVVVSGMSGAGRSTAAHSLEDPRLVRGG
jgi:NAD-dependent DNA ligase